MRKVAEEERACAKALGMSSLLWLCFSVSSQTQAATLRNLHSGSFKLWVTVSTVAGQGPPGPDLSLHLPGMSWGRGDACPFPARGALKS